jgi:hypothetical protein
MTDAGRAAIERAKQDGSWTYLDDVEALVIPADLAALLATDAGPAVAGGARGPTLTGVHKPIGKGSKIRLRRTYKPGRTQITDGALMRSPQLVSKANYDILKAYTKKILTRFPPDHYFYVGCGRTPTPIIAMLKNLGPSVAMNFPASSMKVDGRAMFAKYRDNYTEHIEQLIPEEIRTGDRKILLMDYSSGPSLRGLQGALDAYREAGNPLPEVELLVVGQNATWAHAINEGAYWDHREAVAEFEGETYDKGHIIHSAQGTLSALSRNPKHAEHRRTIFQRMMRDEDLDQFLRDNFSHLVEGGKR